MGYYGTEYVIYWGFSSLKDARLKKNQFLLFQIKAL